MWGPAIDTAVGLTFLFAITALLCSALLEGYATVAQRRAQYLLTAIVNMLDWSESSGGRPPDMKPKDVHKLVKEPASGSAPDSDSLTVRLFDQHMVRSLQTRKVALGRDGELRNPQYIPSSVFVTALLSALRSYAGETGSRPPSAQQVLRTLRRGVKNLSPKVKARATLLDLLDHAGSDLDAFRTSLQEWYEAEMGRISGWYKRWAQRVLLIMGFAVAALANVDTVSVTHTLWVDEPVRAAVVAQATNGTLCPQEDDAQQRQACAREQLGQLTAAKVPIGPGAGCALDDLGACFVSSVTTPNILVAFALKLLGFALTAIAVSFGAPFWFDALSKLGNLRSAGRKPDAATSS